MKHDPGGPRMTFRLEAFADVGLSQGLLRLLLAEHERRTRPRLDKLWSYYRNAPIGGAERSGSSITGQKPAPRLAQSCGLPARFSRRDASMDDRRPAPEIVIENDIAWRIQAMVDFMFGKPVSIVSTAADESTRRQVERVLDAVWEASGGIALLQDLALLGHAPLYGHADLLRSAYAALIRAGALCWAQVGEALPIRPFLDPVISSCRLHAAPRQYLGTTPRRGTYAI